MYLCRYLVKVQSISEYTEIQKVGSKKPVLYKKEHENAQGCSFYFKLQRF